MMLVFALLNLSLYFTNDLVLCVLLSFNNNNNNNNNIVLVTVYHVLSWTDVTDERAAEI